METNDLEKEIAFFFIKARIQ